MKKKIVNGLFFTFILSILIGIIIFSPLLLQNKKQTIFQPNPVIASTIISPTIEQKNSPSELSNPLIELLSILFNLASLNQDKIPSSSAPSQLLSISPFLTISPNLSPSFPIPSKKTSPFPTKELVYYPQCGGSFDSYPLPSGCTLCQAGCGPTTVAMILASYVDKSINPKTMVDFYKQKGYVLGCVGSRSSEAKMVLMSYGLKTTDYFINSSSNPKTIDEVASEMKNYLKSGWTIFALANYCDEGCGHFFWIVDITDNNDTWAYDPYYGRLQLPPYNEKSRYPFPKYKIAFGVKK